MAVEQVLRGWTDFHWRGNVLVARDPNGRAWSMGEMSQRGRTASDPATQRIGRLDVLRPNGRVLDTIFPYRRWDAMELARRLIVASGGRMRTQTRE